mmetsp:Transcript_43398/g.132021  ORF Transcript_43398/g.132021 Transcript_43398/m.132021 type:complete len:286 (-) Transcript_43398:1363-2220(-)
MPPVCVRGAGATAVAVLRMRCELLQDVPEGVQAAEVRGTLLAFEVAQYEPQRGLHVVPPDADPHARAGGQGHEGLVLKVKTRDDVARRAGGVEGDVTPQASRAGVNLEGILLGLLLLLLLLLLGRQLRPSVLAPGSPVGRHDHLRDDGVGGAVLGAPPPEEAHREGPYGVPDGNVCPLPAAIAAALLPQLPQHPLPEERQRQRPPGDQLAARAQGQLGSPVWRGGDAVREDLPGLSVEARVGTFGGPLSLDGGRSGGMGFLSLPLHCRLRLLRRLGLGLRLGLLV